MEVRNLSGGIAYSPKHRSMSTKSERQQAFKNNWCFFSLAPLPCASRCWSGVLCRVQER